MTGPDVRGAGLDRLMIFNSPIFRKLFTCTLLPAAAVLIFVAIDFRHSALYRWLPLGIVLAVVVSYFVARLAAGAITDRVRTMQAFAETLVSAKPAQPADLSPADDELGSLARSLKRASAGWQSLVEQLQLESARRETVLKSMAEGVLAVDNDSRVIFCNTSFANLVGARLPLPPRVPLVDLVRDPGLSGMLAQVLAANEPMRQTLQLAAADGRVFEVHATPLAGPTQTGALAILHDVTGIERLERVRKDFVANVSHELRTPLTAIRGYAEALLDGGVDDPAERRRFLQVILNHSIRLDHIASDLLVLSELESARAQPETERVSVPDAVETALHAVEAESEARSVTLCRKDLAPAEVVGSRVRLEQALINLLTNAVRFNRPGGAVEVSVRRAGDEISIVVSDNGIGIPSGDLSRIFERFYRVDKARSREVGGTGLGLAIVKHTVERMGGGVKVESQIGKGATFTVTLPSAADRA